MSKLQTNTIQHTANGSAVYTLPQTDGSAGQVLQTNGSGVLSWVTLPSGGLSVAQQFRQTGTTATNNSTNYFTSGWEKADGTAQNGFGSFADPSSGIFTFPTPGFYLVTFQSYFEDAGFDPNCQVKIQATTDNSSYSTISTVNFGTTNDNSGYNYGTGFVTSIVDVTDVTQVKVRFAVFSSASVSWDGSNSQNRTVATFLRLGDT